MEPNPILEIFILHHGTSVSINFNNQCIFLHSIPGHFIFCLYQYIPIGIKQKHNLTMSFFLFRTATL